MTGPGAGGRGGQPVPRRRRLRPRGGPPAGRAAAARRRRVVDYGIRGMHLAYDLLDGYDALVIVDAVPRGGAPGDLCRARGRPRRLRRRRASTRTAWSRPRCWPASGRSAARCRRTYVVGCEPADIDEGIGLSPPVAGRGRARPWTPCCELLADGERTGRTAMRVVGWIATGLVGRRSWSGSPSPAPLGRGRQALRAHAADVGSGPCTRWATARACCRRSSDRAAGRPVARIGVRIGALHRVVAGRVRAVVPDGGGRRRRPTAPPPSSGRAGARALHGLPARLRERGPVARLPALRLLDVAVEGGDEVVLEWVRRRHVAPTLGRARARPHHLEG